MQEIEKLLTHERRKHCFFDPQEKRFVVYHPSEPGGRPLVPLTYPGIRGKMKTAFFPDFVYDSDAIRNAKQTDSALGYDSLETMYVLRKTRKPRPDPNNRDAYEDWLRNDAAPRDIEGGLMVHSQVEAMVNGGRGNTGDTINMLYSRDHPWFTTIKDALSESKYVGVIAECTVFDECLGYATKIDLIAYSVIKRRLVAIELKTGYETNFCVGQGTMRGPPSVLFSSCSFKNQAMLQVTIPCLTLYHQYGVRVYPEVWHVCNEGLTRYALSSDIFSISICRNLYVGCIRFMQEQGIKAPAQIALEKKRRAGPMPVQEKKKRKRKKK